MKLNNVTHRLLGKEKHWKLKWRGKPRKTEGVGQDSQCAKLALAV